MNYDHANLYGVNLGGWLVLEKWITPSLFKDLNAADESSFCTELGDKKVEVLDKHRKQFITGQDFKWIQECGLNAVRIPVGHWILGDTEPYVGNIEYLDFAFEMAEKYELKIIIDLHAAPGSQNGYDHSGIIGKIEWHKNSYYIERTIEVIAKLSERYAKHANLAGIELMNEPSNSIPKKILLNFYLMAIEQVRKYCEDSVLIVISDAFSPNVWSTELTGDTYKNITLDMHLYQCFDSRDKKLDIDKHVYKADHEWSQLITRINRHRPVIIGEWSLGLDETTFEGMNGTERKQAIKDYATAQLVSFNQSFGWFFWTYKTQNRDNWNFRHCVETGLLLLPD